MATYVLTIAGSTKSLQPGWAINESANGRATFNGAVVSTTASYRPALSAEVILTEDGTRIFGGYIDTPSEQGLGGFGITGIQTNISATDYNELADRRSVIDGGFPAGYTLKQALTSLVGYLTDYGVTLHGSQADGPTLPLLVYDVRTVRSIFDELSVITGYLWRIDYDKKLRMIAPGDLAAPFSVTTANRFAEGDVTVEPSRVEYANKIILLAGTGTGEVTDTFTGNGSTTNFILSYPLYSDRGYVTNGAATETLGSGATWSYDGATNSITRTSAPANLNAISITYIAQYPVRVTADGGAAAADVVEKVITAPDTFDIIVAQALADGYLDRAMAAATSTVRYRTRQVEVHPGQTQTITVSGRNVSGTYLVTEVRVVNSGGNVVFRDVTAVSGTTYPGSWRDAYRSSGSTGTTVGGTVSITSGGSIAGTGTSGKVAQWTTSTTLGDGPTASTIVLTSGSYADPAWITSLSAAKLSGNLAYAQMPTGSGTWTATPAIAGTLSTQNVVPSLTDTYDLGSSSLLWRNGYLSQLTAVLFAKETQTLYGGWLSVQKNAGAFPSAVAVGATTIDFGQSMTANQFVVLRGYDSGGSIRAEYIKVVSVSSGTTYNVERDKANSNPTNQGWGWPAGAPYAVRGVSGDGWIELNAFDTPRLSIFTQGSAYNNSTETIRIGHLSGMPNSSSGIGSYMGDSTNYMRWDGSELKIVSANLTIDSTGVTLLTNTSGAVANLNAYAFSAMGLSGSTFGTFAYGNGSTTRQILVDNSTSSTGKTLTTTIRVFASDFPNSSTTITMTGSSAGTNIAIASDSIAAFCTSGFQMGTGSYLYPGTANGLSSRQTTYYLASRADYTGLYTNGAMASGGDMYAVGGFFRAAVNGGGLLVLNAAAGAYLQAVGVDGSNQTFLHANSAALRVVGGTVGAPGTQPTTYAGWLSVTIDGIGACKLRVWT